jgi:hypothetical protein
MASAQNGPVPDPGSRRILEELRDIRVEMREMRVEMREDRQRSDVERRRSDERFERMMREFREDSARREAATQKALKELRTNLRTVGLAIVKTLNRQTRILEHISGHHGRLLERIDRKLGARNNGRPGRDNGRDA